MLSERQQGVIPTGRKLEMLGHRLRSMGGTPQVPKNDPACVEEDWDCDDAEGTMGRSEVGHVNKAVSHGQGPDMSIRSPVLGDRKLAQGFDSLVEMEEEKVERIGVMPRVQVSPKKKKGSNTGKKYELRKKNSFDSKWSDLDQELSSVQTKQASKEVDDLEQKLAEKLAKFSDHKKQQEEVVEEQQEEAKLDEENSQILVEGQEIPSLDALSKVEELDGGPSEMKASKSIQEEEEEGDAMYDFGGNESEHSEFEEEVEETKEEVETESTILKRPPPPTTGAPIGGKASDKIRAQLYQLRKMKQDSAELDGTLQHLTLRLTGRNDRPASASPRPGPDLAETVSSWKPEEFNLDVLKAKRSPDSFDPLLEVKLSARGVERKSINNHNICDGGHGVDQIETAMEAGEEQAEEVAEEKAKETKTEETTEDQEKTKVEEPDFVAPCESDFELEDFGADEDHPQQQQKIEDTSTAEISAKENVEDPDYDPKQLFERSVEVNEEEAASTMSLTIPTLQLSDLQTKHFLSEPEDKVEDGAHVEEDETEQESYEDWTILYTEDGYPYYYCERTGESNWEDPRATFYHGENVLEAGETWLDQWYRRNQAHNHSTTNTGTEQEDYHPQEHDTSLNDEEKEERYEDYYNYAQNEIKSGRSFANSSARWKPSDIARYESQGYLNSGRSSIYSSQYNVVPPLNLNYDAYSSGGMLSSHRTKTVREMELEEQLRYASARAQWLEHEAYYCREAEKAASLRAHHTAKSQATMAERVRQEERRKSIMELSQAWGMAPPTEPFTPQSTNLDSIV